MQLLLTQLLLLAAAATSGSLTNSGVPAVGLYGPNRYDGIPDDCLLPMEFGYCRAKVKRYYFDVRRMKCAMFFWGGCAGNLNNFKSIDECNQVCLDAYEDVAQSHNVTAAQQVGQQQQSRSSNSNYNSNANNNANIRTGSTVSAPIASTATTATPTITGGGGGLNANSKYAVADKGSNFKSYLNKYNQRNADNNNASNNNNNNNKNAAANDNVFAASEDYEDEEADAEEEPVEQ